MLRTALAAEGIQGMTISEVRGFGRQKGHTEMYRGQEYTVDFVPKVKIEIVVPNVCARRAIDTIMRAAQTGQIGDGKIFVVSLDETVRISYGRNRRRGRVVLRHNQKSGSALWQKHYVFIAAKPLACLADVL